MPKTKELVRIASPSDGIRVLEVEQMPIPKEKREKSRQQKFVFAPMSIVGEINITSYFVKTYGGGGIRTPVNAFS
jgi:hypothetical protein